MRAIVTMENMLTSLQCRHNTHGTVPIELTVFVKVFNDISV